LVKVFYVAAALAVIQVKAAYLNFTIYDSKEMPNNYVDGVNTYL